MGAYLFPADAVAGAPSYTGRMLRQLLGALTGGSTSARPLGSRSGVSPGTPASTVSATSTTWTVQPHAGVMDVEAAVQAGAYHYSFDTAQTGAMTAANASNPRIDILWVRVDDPAESDGSSTPAVSIQYTAGTAAASPAIPVPTGTGSARSMVLAQINVPTSGGGSPTVTWVAPVCVAAGGIIPMPAGTRPASPYSGQYIDDATAGLLRSNGSTWGPAVKAIVGIALTDGASHLIGTSNTTASIGVWTSNYLSAGATASGMSIGSTGITIGVTGLYWVSGSLSYDESTNSTGRRAVWQSVQSGGAGSFVGVGASTRQIIAAVAGGTSVAMVAQPMLLNAGDVVSAVPFQSSGVNINYTTGSLAVALIGAA